MSNKEVVSMENSLYQKVNDEIMKADSKNRISFDIPLDAGYNFNVSEILLTIIQQFGVTIYNLKSEQEYNNDGNEVVSQHYCAKNVEIFCSIETDFRGFEIDVTISLKGEENLIEIYRDIIQRIIKKIGAANLIY